MTTNSVAGCLLLDMEFLRWDVLVLEHIPSELLYWLHPAQLKVVPQLIFLQISVLPAAEALQETQMKHLQVKKKRKLQQVLQAINNKQSHREVLAGKNINYYLLAQNLSLIVFGYFL